MTTLVAHSKLNAEVKANSHIIRHFFQKVFKNCLKKEKKRQKSVFHFPAIRGLIGSPYNTQSSHLKSLPDLVESLYWVRLGIRLQ